MGVNLANDDELRALADTGQRRRSSRWQRRAAGAGQRGHRRHASRSPIPPIAAKRRPAGRPPTRRRSSRRCATRSRRAAGWDATPAASRATILEHAADLLEERMPEFIALCTKEAGKTLAGGGRRSARGGGFPAATTPGRRASCSARRKSCPARPANPTNCSCTAAACSSASARGISRWRSSSGQVAAALAAGNSVIAKPAEQTNLIGFCRGEAAARSRRAGRRAAVPARRRRHRRRRADPRSARGRRRVHRLDRHRAGDQSRAGRARRRASATLIAETGGQNALIADSSALPEQLVKDAMVAAFDFRRPALLGGAHAVRAGRHRRQGDRACWPARWTRLVVGDPGAAVHRRRPGDRRGRAGHAGRARRAHGQAKPS